MKNKDSKRSLARQNYDNSPIVEALAEIYFSNTKTDFSVWADFSGRVKSSYPNVEELVIPKTELQISPDGEGRQKISPEKLYRFYNISKTRIIQANKDFVTLNQLGKYSGYDHFKQEISEALKNYRDVASPKSVDRIGVRYVNEIVIPQASIELSEYFNFMPQIPGNITETINSVLLQIEFVPEKSTHHMTLSLRSGFSRVEDHSVFLLDIYDTLLIRNETDIEFILKSIDEAHENIEQVFERIITDKARNIFGVKKNDRKSRTSIQK